MFRGDGPEERSRGTDIVWEMATKVKKEKRLGEGAVVRAMKVWEIVTDKGRQQGEGA